MPTLYVAITNHGFGHVTRTAAIIDCLLQLDPDILPIFITTAPRWLIEKYVSGKFLHRPRALDVGVVQADSLAMNFDATLAELQELRQTSDAIIRAEVDFIRLNRVQLVFGDIPPLACAIARAAGVPCWMASNFGWDFIYREAGAAFQAYADWMSELYGQCDRLFRLPMCEPMSAFPHIEAVGLTGGNPQLPAEAMREKLHLDPHRPTILLSFGGMGIRNIPYQNLAAYPDWQFVSLDSDAPELPNLLKLDGEIWRPVDLMPVCDRLVSKPGYGTLSEAMRVGTPISCITREGFAEAPILLDGIRRYSKHQILTPAQVFEQPWDWLQAPLQNPSHPETVDKDGNQAIARALCEALQ
jgi:hypothetical protein